MMFVALVALVALVAIVSVVSLLREEYGGDVSHSRDGFLSMHWVAQDIVLGLTGNSQLPQVHASFPLSTWIYA